MSESDNRLRTLPRSRIETIALILRSCIRTKLIQKSDLSFPHLGLYASYLSKAGLLKASKGKDGTRIFKTTRKGREFLRDYERIKEIMIRRERMGP